jgi:hypothetical protein
MTSEIELQAVLAANLKSLELLFDYTKFHIGVYLTLASSFITVASLKKGDGYVVALRMPLVWVTILFFMLAGLAGGVVISTITQCYGIEIPSSPAKCTSTKDLLQSYIGPWNWTAVQLTGRTWTYIEHTSFWLGLISAFLAFAARKVETEGVPAEEPLSVKVQGSIYIEREEV